MNTTLSSTDALPREDWLRYFQSGTSWAGPDYVVIPGSLSKEPLVKWKRFVRPAMETPSREDRIFFRAKSFDQPINPLLLLDSKQDSLCVIDVDDMSAWKEVLAWLVEKGISQTLVVETGREGGGKHLYFRRFLGQEERYRSGLALRFGKGAEGKARVDLKAVNSYAVCPGARHKSGRVYRAYWGGEEVGSLEDVIGRIPRLSPEDWKLLHGKEGKESLDREFVSVGDPEWKQVFALSAKGLTRQPCPWCKRGGDRVLAVTNGVARCFFENKTRMLAPKKTKADEIIEEMISRPEENNEEFATALDRALASLHEDDDEYPLPLFPDDDPLKEWDRESLAAAILSAKLGLYAAPLSCPRGGVTTIIAKGSEVSQTRTCCWSLTCSACGPRLLKHLQASILAAVGSSLESAARGDGGSGLIVKPIRPEPPSGDRAALVEAPYSTSGFDKGLRRRLDRWVKATGGQWVALRPSPDEVKVILWGADFPDWHDPDSVGPLEGILSWALSSVDLDEWREWCEAKEREHLLKTGEKKHSHVELVLAPSSMRSKIKSIMDFTTGRGRQADGGGRALMVKRKPKGCPKSEDYFTVTTFFGSKLKPFLESKLQSTIDPDYSGSTGRKETGIMHLPCPSAPLLREWVDSDPRIRAGRGKGATPRSGPAINLED